MISANLIGKCLLIGGAGAATGTGAYYIKETYFSNNKELMALAEKVGLSCLGKPTETFGVECKKIDGKNINLKQGEESPFEATAISGGKITVYKTSDKTYHKEFKFVIEDGDISATTAAASGSASTTKKLEQFETYEIKEEGEKHNLKRKSEAKEEIKKALGLPAEDTSCNLPTSGETTCTLTADKLKAINFEGKTKEMAVVNPAAAGGDAESLTLKMKVVAATDAENSTFPHGYKFTLVSNRDITLGGDKSIKKDTNTEFKIKVTPASGGPKVLTLEKAWNVTELGKLVGLECPDNAETAEKKECSLTPLKVNVNNGESNKKFENHSKKDADDKKVKYVIDHDGHSQGFKFYAEQEICLKDSSDGSGTDKKIEAKGTAANSPITYEIKKDTDGKWYLTKKTTTNTPA